MQVLATAQRPQSAHLYPAVLSWAAVTRLIHQRSPYTTVQIIEFAQIPPRPMTEKMDKYKSLRSTTFGHRVAEEETDALSAYFVETDSWERVFRGDIDVIYGAKGAGKSALYSLMLSRNGDLFDRNILLVAAENPRGAPAFKNLLLDPPASEREFVNLWKLYFISLLHNLLTEYGIKSDATTQLQQALEREGLVKGNLSLAGLLSGIVDYVRGALRPRPSRAESNSIPSASCRKDSRERLSFLSRQRRQLTLTFVPLMPYWSLQTQL